MFNLWVDRIYRAVLIFIVAAALGYVIEPLFFKNVPDKLIAKETRTRTTQKPKAENKDGKVKPTKGELAADEGGNNDDKRVVESENDDREKIEEHETKTDRGEMVDVKKVRLSLKEDEGDGPVQEPPHIGKRTALQWTNPKLVKRQLAMNIRANLSKVGINNIIEFLKDKEVRLMLAQWQLLHSSDIDVLANLMRDKKVSESLAPLLNDLPWVSSFVYDGEFAHGEIALAMLYHLRQTDPNMDRDIIEDNSKVQIGMKRRIAAAVAAEFARHGWHELATSAPKAKSGRDRRVANLMGEYATDFARTRSNMPRQGKTNQRTQDPYCLARERYQYFARSWEKGMLNTSFGSTPGWLMRFICGWQGASKFGTVSTMEWLRDNIALPVEDYSSAHVFVPYLPTNKYGDSIFSGMYYEPYDVLYPGNYSKEVRDVGGVCVQLSHFGAAAACSNGVPGLILAEPGHCAYAVYINGRWVPSNSYSENRMLGEKYWDMESFNDLELLSQMFSQGQRTRDAQLICSLAALFHEANDERNSRSLYEVSLAIQPLYLPLWNHYIDTIGPILKRRPKEAMVANEFLCSHLAPEHPELCSHYLEEYIYPLMLQSIRRPNERLKVFMSYIEHLKTNEKREWPMGEVLENHFAALGRQTHIRHQYIESICEMVQKHPSFVPAMGWAVNKALRENKVLSTKVLKMVDAALEGLSAQDKEQAPMRRALHASIIRAAEDIRAMLLQDSRIKWPRVEFCKQLVEKYSQEYLDPNGKSSLPPFTSPGGNLISPGSIAMIDSYSADQDHFLQHAAAFTLQGGCIRSEKGAGRNLTIELPQASFIGGIVIIPFGGCGVYADWYVETSIDGKKWQLLQELPNELDEKSITINIKHSAPRAKFIRINSGGGVFLPGIDFKAVLVYDNHKSAH